MTADRFHDAISLLPGDLIAEADRRRSGRPKTLRWKRCAAMAACFVLILFAGRFGAAILAPKGGIGATESAVAIDVPAAAAPMEVLTEAAADEEPAANAASTQEQSASESYSIQRDALEDGLTSGFLNADWIQTPYGDAANYASASCVTLIPSREALDAYAQQEAQDRTAMLEHASYREEGWFDRYDLVAVRLPMTEPELLRIRESEDGWTIVLPEPGQKAQSYHLLLTVEKGLVSDEERIHIDFA